MYATMRYYHQNSELADALVENQGEVKRIIGGIDGFEAYYLIRTGDGSTVSVTVFENRAGAEESNRVAAEWLSENVPEVAVNPPMISAGEVLISA
jgi:heme-degrading monooxygenase HmoA